MKVFSLLLLFQLFLSGKSIDFSCPDGIFVFDRPEDRSKETWYPTSFQDSQPPMFPMDFECEYQINVPEGWFAEIDLTLGASNEDGPAPVQIIDELQGMEKVSSAAGKTYFFISGGGKIKISTKNKNYLFGFSVYWDQYFSGKPDRQVATTNDKEPLVLTFRDYRPSVIKSETRVSASVMPPPDDNAERLLRGTLFFDGPSSNSTCIGTGLQLLNRKTQFISSGNTMTILFLGYYDYSDVKVLIQDYEITKNIKEFQGLYCYDNKDCGTVTMDASHGSSILQSLSLSMTRFSSDVILNLEGTGRLQVFSGGINRGAMVTEYLSPFNALDFPQKFNGFMITYVLTEGKVSMTVTRKDDKNEKTESFGRKGVVTSSKYGIDEMYQSSYSMIKSPDGKYARFEYTVETADLDNDMSKLNVIGEMDGRVVHDEDYLSSHYPKLNEVQVFYGDRLRVQYNIGRYNSKGFKLNYKVLNGSSGFQILIIFIFVFATLF